MEVVRHGGMEGLRGDVSSEEEEGPQNILGRCPRHATFLSSEEEGLAPNSSHGSCAPKDVSRAPKGTCAPNGTRPSVSARSCCHARTCQVTHVNASARGDGGASASASVDVSVGGGVSVRVAARLASFYGFE